MSSNMTQKIKVSLSDFLSLFAVRKGKKVYIRLVGLVVCVLQKMKVHINNCRNEFQIKFSTTIIY